jgi:hypothetical protein
MAVRCGPLTDYNGPYQGLREMASPGIATFRRGGAVGEALTSDREPSGKSRPGDPRKTCGGAFLILVSALAGDRPRWLRMPVIVSASPPVIGRSLSADRRGRCCHTRILRAALQLQLTRQPAITRTGEPAATGHPAGHAAGRTPQEKPVGVGHSSRPVRERPCVARVCAAGRRGMTCMLVPGCRGRVVSDGQSGFRFDRVSNVWRGYVDEV